MWVEILYVCVIWPEGPPFNNYPSIIGLCNVVNDTFYVANSVIEFVCYFVSLMINCALYISIVYKLKKDQTHNVQQTRRNHLRAVCKMVIVNGAALFLCVTPWCCHKFFIKPRKIQSLVHNSARTRHLLLVCQNFIVHQFDDQSIHLWHV